MKTFTRCSTACSNVRGLVRSRCWQPRECELLKLWTTFEKKKTVLWFQYCQRKVWTVNLPDTSGEELDCWSIGTGACELWKSWNISGKRFIFYSQGTACDVNIFFYHGGTLPYTGNIILGILNTQPPRPPIHHCRTATRSICLGHNALLTLKHPDYLRATLLPIMSTAILHKVLQLWRLHKWPSKTLGRTLWDESCKMSVVKPTKCTKVSNLFCLESHSTCFGRSFRPSSGVQDCTYSNRHVSNRYCRLLASVRTVCPSIIRSSRLYCWTAVCLLAGTR